MHDLELRAIQRELAALSRGPGKRYPDELRARIVDWARRRLGRGVSMTASADELALHPRTLGQWLACADRDDDRRENRALVPVEVVEAAPASDALIALVSPSGFRIEGLTLDEAVRALARLR